MIKNDLQHLRDADKFDHIVSLARRDIEDFDMMEFSLPRKRKVPMRLGGGEINSTAFSVSDVYRPDYFKMLDAAVQNLEKYFTSTDLKKYGELCAVLLQGTDPSDIMKNYPELSSDASMEELRFFHRQFCVGNLDSVQKLFAEMSPDVKKMFPNVE